MQEIVCRFRTCTISERRYASLSRLRICHETVGHTMRTRFVEPFVITVFAIQEAYGVVTTMLFSLSGVVAMLAAPSRAPSFTASAAVVPVLRSSSF